MSRELTATGQICVALDKMAGSLDEALKGTGVSVARFLATAKTAVQTHTSQAALEKADRQSLYLAIKKAASDGLMPDNREAALVVYGNQVQYQPMVQGLVKLARKSGEIEKLGAFIVCEKDSFKFEVGHDDIPKHSAPLDENGNHLWFGDRGKPIGVWAFVKLKSGEFLDPIMLTQERVNRIATRSKIAKNYSPEFGPDWEEWWKKAAIRNILKYAPKSTSLEQAMSEIDNEFEFAEDGVSHDSAPVNPVSDAPKTESKAAAAVKAKAAATNYGPLNPDPAHAVIDVESTTYTPGESENAEEEEEIPV